MTLQPKPLDQSTKDVVVQSLGKDVRQIVLRRNLYCHNRAISNLLTNVVVPRIHVLRPIVKHRVISDVISRFIVNIQRQAVNADPLNIKIVDDLAKPYSLLRSL